MTELDEDSGGLLVAARVTLREGRVEAHAVAEEYTGLTRGRRDVGASSSVISLRCPGMALATGQGEAFVGGKEEERRGKKEEKKGIISCICVMFFVCDSYDQYVAALKIVRASIISLHQQAK